MSKEKCIYCGNKLFKKTLENSIDFIQCVKCKALYEDIPAINDEKKRQIEFKEKLKDREKILITINKNKKIGKHMM